MSAASTARRDQARSHCYLPGERQPLHRHRDVRMIIITKGAFCEEGFGVGDIFSPGDVIVRPALIAHADLAGEAGASYLQFKAPPAFLKQSRWRHGWAAARGRIDLHDKAVRKALRKCSAPDFIIESADQPAYAAPISGSPLNVVARQISNDFDQDLSAIASKMNLHNYEFARRFKRSFGISPRAYANGARLERALGMLASSSESIAGIAAACGYYDQSHLCRAIKRELSLTPREFSSFAQI